MTMIEEGKKILVTNVQRFSLHDGPGIRTTIFLKGCSLRCPWCSNPENINGQCEQYIKNGIHGLYGKYVTCNELYEEILKDEVYYSNNLGGVTFSGGEPLLQIRTYEPLLKELKNRNIHIAVETSLFVSDECLQIALKYIDLFYVDIKILDKKRCHMILGGNFDTYRNNVRCLFGSNKKIICRIPVVRGYTDDEENIREVICFLKEFTPLKVELIKAHDLGAEKYISLGMNVPKFEDIEEECMFSYKKRIENIGIEVEICRI